MLSKYTAFLAVKENNEPVEGTMVTRDVTKQLEREAQYVCIVVSKCW